ncbi:serine/threonine protein kinase [Myxococcus stipitatus]|uniref:serine/threonine-protein kinase n=1 Tax=Myxococcus stipitatus TaxID=83455 RepID=UPI001F2E8107|nr:serine/threonine-protein kinase [Myxococcus stipitatus]MCE9667321.1 serine/threonine protein kinase [Myxococcus stipitatus]
MTALLEGRLAMAANSLAHRHAAECSACRALLVALARGDGASSEDLAPRSSPDRGLSPSWRTSRARATWTPPRQVDEFHLVRLLGRGGMGAVYLAQDTATGRRVALKVCVARQPDAGTLASFAIEARAISRIEHPNVVAMYRVGEVGGRPYLVYEYVEGQCLVELRPPLPWRRVLDIAVGLARGLRAAHQRGVLHRDIKPGNAILAPDGTAKLLDFGLATFVGAERLTATSRASVVGTPRYMAPEVRAGGLATPRSDLYALGLLLFELCTGQVPSTRSGAARAGPRPGSGRGMGALISEEVPGIDPGFAAAIGCCLAEAPEERFAQADALCAVLEQVARSGFHASTADWLSPAMPRGGAGQRSEGQAGPGP